MTSRLLRIKMAVAGVLGWACSICKERGAWPWEPTGAEQGYPALQVGHKNGRRWSIRRANRYTRWLRYLREALAGKVQAECGPCNRKHGGGLRYRTIDKTRQGAKRRGLMKIGQAIEQAAAANSHEFHRNQG